MPLSLNRRAARDVGWLAFMLLAIQPAHSAEAQQLPSSSLTVEVAGLKNTAGQVCFSLFESSEGFPQAEEAVIARQCVAASTATIESATSADALEAMAGRLSVVFEGLESGTYAVSVLHDENEDSQINTGLFGVPTEGFGFSRNPTIRTSVPAFREAAVFVLGRRATTQIDLIYY
ncbi:DUF2141 domain-containing protein [Leptolyngbya sp. BC1307]|uniref:DUF2141 domain-containing protein n=1 Tax=Leptolyngbya sp. BC1307 TaxID=2029589 RepID=UPI00197D271D|nr:DUF2141 domain-containing protein [Leptolyngbya sp. BC1307]